MSDPDQRKYIHLSKEYIDSSLAAQLSGYSTNHIARLCRSDEIDCVKDGGEWRVDRSSLERYQVLKYEAQEKLKKELSEKRRREYQEANKVTLVEWLAKGEAPQALRFVSGIAVVFAMLTAFAVHDFSWKAARGAWLAHGSALVAQTQHLGNNGSVASEKVGNVQNVHNEGYAQLAALLPAWLDGLFWSPPTTYTPPPLILPRTTHTTVEHTQPTTIHHTPTTVVNNITESITYSGVSAHDLTERLEQLENALRSDLYAFTAKYEGRTTANYRAIQHSNIINTLDGITITNPTIQGGSISGIDLGATTLNGLSDVSVSSPSYGTLVYYDGSTWTSIATSSLGISGTSQWNTSGSNIYYTTGNIGVGTTSPYAALSVVGEAVASHFTATTTATSTYTGGIETNLLNVTSTTATSTFANGIDLSSGCFSVNGVCVTGGGSGGSSFGQAWEISNGALAPTTTQGILVAASSTIQSLSTTNSTSTNATTTNLAVSSFASTSNLIVSNNFTLSNVSGFLKATAGAVATSLIDLAVDVTGILPLANGGTGWSNIQANTLLLGNGTSQLATTTQGTNGQTLALVGGVPSWVSTTTAGTGLSYDGTSFNLDASGDWTGTFDGQEGSYYLNASNLTNFGTPFYTFFNATTTDALSEGSTNQYFTTARALSNFITNLSATSSVASITTLANLSITESQISDLGSYLTSYDAWTHPASGTSATSSEIRITGGLLSTASTTIGNGSQTGGLTISGGATTTGNAYFAGNVGIGTTNPNSLLHVSGTSAGNFLNLERTDTSDYLTVDFAGGTATLDVSSAFNLSVTDQNILTYSQADDVLRFYTNDNERITLSAAGNLGISTTSPFAKLSVAGDLFVNDSITGSNITATGTLSVTGQTTLATSLSGVLKATSGVVSTAVAGTDYITDAFRNWTLTTNTFSQSALAPTTTQNLHINGIGTSTFAGGLEAWRQVSAPYFHATGTSATSTFAGGLDVTGTLTVGDGIAGAPSLAFLSDTDTGIYADTTGSLSVAAGGTQSLVVRSSTVYSRTLAGLTGSTYDLGSAGNHWRDAYLLGINLNTTADVAGTGQLALSNANTTATVLLDGNTNADSYFNTGGNVGIGTTSPWANLSVDAGAGEVSFAVGSSTATHFMINENGQVSIGTTTQTNILDVQDTNALVRVVGSSSTGAGQYRAENNAGNNIGLLIYGSGAVGNTFGVSRANAVRFVPSADATAFTIGTASGSSAPLILGTDETERLRITSTGNVGIGTTSPTGTLSLYDSLPILDVGTSDGADNSRLVLSGGGSVGVGRGGYFQAIGNEYTSSNLNGALQLVAGAGDGGSNIGDILFYTGAGVTQRMIIADTGNIGIGASAYLNWGSTLGSSGYGFRDNSGTIQVKNSGGSWTNIPTSGTTQWTTSGSDIYYNTGNVGIGSTTPVDKLSIALATNESGGITLGEDTTTFAKLGDGSSAGTNGVLQLYSGGTENVRIYASSANPSWINAGNVGIGTTSPWAKFAVNPVAGDTNQFVVGSSTATSFVINDAGNVGIGTTTPTFNLDVTSEAGESSAYILVSSADNDSKAILGATNDAVRLYARTLANGVEPFAIQQGTTDVFNIDTSGNIGIGTTTPNEEVVVHVGDAFAELSISSERDGASENLGRIGFSGRTSTAVGQRYAGVKGGIITPTNGATVGALYFETTNALGAMIERMTINGDSVGIGTTSPYAKLSIEQGTEDFSFLVGNQGSSTPSFAVGGVNADGHVGIGSNPISSAELYVAGHARAASFIVDGGSWFTVGGSAGGDDLGFFTNASEQMTINSSGNVGIGTTSPRAPLHISKDGVSYQGAETTLIINSTNGYPGIRFADTGDTTWILRGQDTADNDLYLYRNSGTGASPSYSTVMAFDRSSGNVGIGTTSPSGTLHVEDGTNDQLVLGNPSAADTWSMRVGNTNSLIYKRSGTEYMRIDSSGNVGIGTTSPTYDLEVAGAVYFPHGGSLFGAPDVGSSIDLDYSGYGYMTSSNWKHGILLDPDSAGTGEYFAIYQNQTRASASDSNAYVKFNPAGDSWITGGDLGVGVTDPDIRLEVFETVSAAQFKISYDASRYANFQVNSGGDLIIDAQGGDVSLLDENLYVCTGGSCPSGSPSGTGNAIVETRLGVASSTPFAAIGVEGAVVTAENAKSDSGTISINWLEGNQQRVTIAGHRTINFSNYTDGQTLRLIICQDGSTSKTITWGATIRWSGGSAPTLTPTDDKCDVLSFIATGAHNGSLTIFGASTLNF